MGRIWYSSLSAYARDREISGEAFADLQTFVMALDDEYLEHVQEQIEKQIEKSKEPQ